MKTLQHDKYLSQSPSEQKLLSFSKSKKNKKEDALQIGNDLQRTPDYACIFGSAADRFIR